MKKNKKIRIDNGFDIEDQLHQDLQTKRKSEEQEKAISKMIDEAEMLEFLSTILQFCLFFTFVNLIIDWTFSDDYETDYELPQTYLEQVDNEKLIGFLMGSLEIKEPEVEVANHIYSDPIFNCAFVDCSDTWYRIENSDDFVRALMFSYTLYLKREAGQTDLYEYTADNSTQFSDEVKYIWDEMVTYEYTGLTEKAYDAVMNEEELYSYTDYESKTFRDFLNQYIKFAKENRKLIAAVAESTPVEEPEHEAIKKRREYLEENQDLSQKEIQLVELEIALMQELVEEL